MKDLLSELKNACKGKQSLSDVDTIRRGQSTWFRGRPAHAPEGTIALALSDDARVIINDDDVREVKKDGEHYNVEVSADAHVLLRIDKILKATVHHGCHVGDNRVPVQEKHDTGQERRPTVEIYDIVVCDVVCGDIVLDGVKIHVCVPVNCKKV